MEHVVVIGGGLGGLQCGYILAENGCRVTILEHGVQLGGCLQSFRRGETLFDTGFHYVGGLEEGQSLYPFFRYFGLLDLPWQKMDERCFDEVVIGKESFPLAQGYERFVDELAAFFPQERVSLQRYVDVLRCVGEQAGGAFGIAETPSKSLGLSLEDCWTQSAYDFLSSTFSTPLLRDVLAGTLIKMPIDAARLPFYVFAQINHSFLQSAYRLKGGGQQIAERLRQCIEQRGGRVLTRQTVTRIETSNGKAVGVWVNGEYISADWVVSSAHPAATLAMVDEKAVRRVYRQRVNALVNSMGMFTVNLRLKPDALPYLNRNIYLHREGCSMWQVRPGEVEHLLLHSYPNQWAMDILTPLPYAEVASWGDTSLGTRGADYAAFKQVMAEKCIRLAEKRLPGLADAIDAQFTSTPLSYAHYLLAPEGTAYGVVKDCRSPMTTILSARTPVERLLLTGQNVNLHGILGVSKTSFLTCKEILGFVPTLD